MADFCKQCSIDMFGEDCGDLKGMGNGVNRTQAELDDGMGWPVLCEGCGPTIVNDEGECIGKKCLKKHGDT